MSPEEAEQKIAEMRAEMDQAIEGMKELSRGAATMYKALTDEGVPPESATTMVCTWIAGWRSKGADE